jgi:hypothetical protein
MTGWSRGTGGFELNRDPIAVGGISWASDVFLVDSTIRSLQSGVSGSHHGADDLVAIGLALDALGVRELIVNLSWKHGIETVRGLAAARPNAQIVGTFRARNDQWRTWFDAGIEAGIDEVCFESVRDVRHLHELAEAARDAGCRLSHGFAEAYGWQELVDISRAAVGVGASSLSYHDSYFRLGITPEAMKLFIARLRSEVPDHPPLYVHLSNFYGQATMTAVAAITAGAAAADVCLNVTGHHCGHTSLAEVALVLEDLYGVSTGINLEGITTAIQVVNERTGVPLPLTQPIIGSHAFLGDGAYWAAEEHLPHQDRVHARFPFPPGVVGAEERIVWSDRTVTAEAVRSKLRTLGLPDDEDRAARLTEQLELALERKSGYPNWLTDAEFELLARSVSGEAQG